MDYELRKLQLELEERKEERKMQREAEERRERKEEEEWKAQREMEQEEKKALRELAAQREARETEEREKVRKYELRSQGIEVVETEVDVTTKRQDSFRMSAAIKFVPPYSEDIEQFLESFEKVMKIHKFPCDKWSALIHTKLTGKAQEFFQSYR